MKKSYKINKYRVFDGIFIGVIVIILFIVSIHFVFNSNDPIPINDSISIKETVLDNEYVTIEEGKWSKNIEEIGGIEAYKLFKDTYKALGVNTQHQLAHVFGSSLYLVEGLSGVVACDEAFSFGCLHEFLGQAINDNGFSIMAELNQNCVEHLEDQSLHCQHGIGHGVLSFTGYNYIDLGDDLIPALELCDELTGYDDHPIAGCKGGVFMEYNLQTILEDEGELRPFEEEKGPHFPCDVLDDKYKETCYFWQPQWWQSVFIEDLSSREFLDDEVRINGFRKFGEQCQEIQNSLVQTQCYRGLGNNSPSVIGWDFNLMKKMCSLMPTHDAEIECLGAATGSFLENERFQDTADTLCELSDIGEKEYCLTVSRLPF